MSATAGDVVYVDVRKWPATPRWHWHAFALGEDDHGRWSYVPQGAPVQLAEQSPITTSYPQVIMYPWEALYAARFLPEQADLAVYVDVIAAPSYAPQRVQVVDVDLDVVRHHDGR
ncbi:MAG: DUF402 domain-containing protein [Myxococcales bacterium]|nr:DUF402 domain-containing protein [Myxococcales bacterium]